MAKVAAHITGTVVRIERKPGEAIQPGETLLVLESMKMEMALEAPVGGTVREIRCAEGQAVTEGDVVAVIE